MYTLRPYQQDAVKATIHYFRKYSAPAVLALSTGAGKSLIIAELARLAKGRVLVLAHVKELVEQNHRKYEREMCIRDSRYILFFAYPAPTEKV